MTEKIVLDSMTEISPKASCTISIMLEKPCLPLQIEPNPELENWDIMDIKVGLKSQLYSDSSVPAIVFSSEECLSDMDACLAGMTFTMQVYNNTDIPRRFNFNLIVSPLTV